MGTVLLETDKAINAVSIIFFISGTFIFYYLLFQTRLVPRFISIWGLLGAFMYLTGGLMLMFTVISPSAFSQGIFFAPLALQEVALGFRLVIKGFNPSASTFAGS